MKRENSIMSDIASALLEIQEKENRVERVSMQSNAEPIEAALALSVEVPRLRRTVQAILECVDDGCDCHHCRSVYDIIESELLGAIPQVDEDAIVQAMHNGNAKADIYNMSLDEARNVTGQEMLMRVRCTGKHETCESTTCRYPLCNEGEDAEFGLQGAIPQEESP